MPKLGPFDWKALRTDRNASICFAAGSLFCAVGFVASFVAPDRYFVLVAILSALSAAVGGAGMVCLMPPVDQPPARRSRSASRPSYRRIGR